MRSVAIAIFPGVQALDVAGPLDVFSEANGFLPAGEHYAVTVVGPERGVLRASNGLAIVADSTFDEVPQRFDLVLVAGGPALPVAQPDARLTAWIVQAAARSALYGSVCTGAFALGHAGLLDGRRVTTHWQHARQLADQFPRAQVDFDRIYLRDDRLVTSAGVTCLAALAAGVEKAARDHTTGGPDHADLAVAPGAEQRNAHAIDKRKRVARALRRPTLTDDDEARPRPLVEPVGVGRPAAVMRRQKDIRWWLRRRFREQLD